MNAPLSLIAIDDEPRALQVIQLLTDQVPWVELKQGFRRPLEALAYLQQHRVELMLLDIHMPDLGGMDLLRSLQRPPLVIFTTAYADHALESYQWEAVDYLLKPIELPRLVQALQRAQRRLLPQPSKPDSHASGPGTDWLIIKSGPQVHQVALVQLHYLEASGNHVFFHTTDKKLVASVSLSEAMSWLPEEHFVRIHKSFVVNLRHVTLVERHQVHLAQKTLPIGKTYRRSFLAQYGL